MTNIALGRTESAILTNKSGGSLAQGDVVIVDSANASAVTTTTESGYSSGRIGVVLEPNGIANNASGLIGFSGYVPKINLSSSASLGDLVKTDTVAKQGVRHAAPAQTGDFAQVLQTGTSPTALLLGTPNFLNSLIDPYGLHHRLSGSHADDDEFSTDTSGNYTEVDPSGTTTWAIANHVLSCTFSGQSAADIGAFLKAVTLADNEWFETHLEILTKKLSNFTMAGLVIADGTTGASNAAAVMAYLNNTADELTFEVRTGTLTNMGTAPASFLASGASIMGGLRIRLKRNSSTSFTPYFSLPNGAQFTDFGMGNFNPGFTPTHAGLFVSVWGGAHTALASFDYFRHLS